MGTRFSNPWADVVLGQMWIYCQVTAVVAKSIDAELLSDPRALARHCMQPSEPRLNPLGFHGKRRSIGSRDCLFAEKPSSD
jgi:hypothetical protein